MQEMHRMATLAHARAAGLRRRRRTALGRDRADGPAGRGWRGRRAGAGGRRVPCRARGRCAAGPVAPGGGAPGARRALRARHSRPLRRSDIAARRTRAPLVCRGGLGGDRPGGHSGPGGEDRLDRGSGRRDAARHPGRTRPRLGRGDRRHRGGGRRGGRPGGPVGVAAGAARLRRALPGPARPAVAARALGSRARATRRSAA